MTLSDAAASFAKLVATDTEYFQTAITDQHTEIDWIARQRLLAHKAIDKLFDGLEGAAKAKLDDLLKHTMENGLVTKEILEPIMVPEYGEAK
jgi:hypothetical protein